MKPPTPVQALLIQLADAWQDQDVERIVDCFADDAIYSTSVGPLPGHRYEGKDKIREAVRIMLAKDHGAMPETGQPIICGDWVVWKWKYHFEDAPTIRGCDWLLIENGKIKLKDAYRKCVENPISAPANKVS